MRNMGYKQKLGISVGNYVNVMSDLDGGEICIENR